MSRWSSLLQQRSFAYLLISGGASLAAPTGSLIVISWALAHAFPSSLPPSYPAVALALLGLSSTIPTLGAAIGSGTLADRRDRRKVMQWVNLAALLATLAVAVILVARPESHVGLPGSSGVYLPLWVVLLYPFWALETAAITLFRPAFNASVPRLVARPDLGTANGLVYAVALLLSIGASLAAAGLASYVNWGFALAIPISLFAVTQVSLQLLDADLAPRREGPPRRFFGDVGEGYRYLWQRRDLFELTIAALAVNFFSAVAFVELGLYATYWLDVSDAVLLGALVAAGSLGAAVGGLLVNRLHFEPRAGKFLALFTLGQGAAVLALAFVRSFWLALPDMFLFGLFPGMFTTVFLATVQATVPDDKLGRVLAADEVGSYALVPFGQYAGGLLTVASSIQATYISAGIGTVGVGGLMASMRDIRRLRFTTRPGRVERAEPASPTPEPAVP
ncbi:MAG: MFS transporter [Thermoplasmata archaeon]|nr:MFS transporter [Thermoplasmata archaeon]